MTSAELNIVMQIATWIAVVFGAWFAIVKFVSPIWKRIQNWITTWERFMLDWSGEPARPGRDAVPGVMERLNQIDGEFRNNGGSSLKDAIDRIESRLETGDQIFNDVQKEIQDIKKKIK
jgi:hypothetical protein